MGNQWSSIFGEALLVLIPMILSLTVHEYAHALAAWVLGDNTAEQQGRLTLNPIAHADPLGTCLLPLILLMANGAAGARGVPFFGWAKPVPTNPTKFTRCSNLKIGMMIVAAAGPLANLVLAFASAAFVSYSLHRGAGAGEGGVVDGVVYLLGNYLFPINLALFVFNMLPIYPLDGQKVAAGLLSGDTSMRFERFSRQYGTLVLWGIIIFGHQILALPFHWTRQGVLHLVGLG